MSWLIGGPALVLVGGMGAIWCLALTRVPSGDLAEEIVCARRHSLLLGITSSAAFVVVAVFVWLRVVLTADIDGSRALAISPLLAAAVAVCVLTVGEKTWPRPRGSMRTAAIRERSLIRLISGPWLVVTALLTVCLVGLLLWAGVAAGANGRQIVPPGSGSDVSAFPGWYYGGPQLLMTAVLWTGLLIVGQLAVLRPASLTSDTRSDDVLRRASISRGLRFAASAIAATLGGNLLIIAEAFGLTPWAVPLRVCAVLLMLTAVGCYVSPIPRVKAHLTTSGSRRGANIDVGHHR